MKKRLKGEDGITLIALVITIIVLLILAGVSIAMLTGENGIITQANNAKVQTEIAQEKEEVSVAYSSAKANKENYDELVTASEMNVELEKLNSKGTAEGIGNLTITFESGREYIINQQTGEITEPSEKEDLIEKLEEAEGNVGIDEDGNIIDNVLDVWQYYINSDKTCVISGNQYNAAYKGGYNQNGELNVKIPVYVKEDNKIYKVVEIGDYTFYENYGDVTELKSITIPEGVTTIGRYAFERCTSLTNVTISESVNMIEKYAFLDCTSLINIIIPESIASVEEDAFKGCNNITITMNKPEGSIEGEPWGATNANVIWKETTE